MPAKRAQRKKQRHEPVRLAGIQQPWSVPVGPAAISFTKNVTPETFHDPPAVPIDAPTDSLLYPSPTATPSPSSSRTSKKQKQPDHIPRPPNCFMLFRAYVVKRKLIPPTVEPNHSVLSKVIGKAWHALPVEERERWKTLSNIKAAEHKIKYPDWCFTPQYQQSEGARSSRKAREVSTGHDERLDEIAGYLSQGMVGLDLDTAMQEFDLRHVYEVAARFEAPLTADTYARASSAPLPDTEGTNSSRKSKGEGRGKGKGKPRAASSRPQCSSAPLSPPSSSMSSSPYSSLYDLVATPELAYSPSSSSSSLSSYASPAPSSPAPSNYVSSTPIDPCAYPLDASALLGMDSYTGYENALEFSQGSQDVYASQTHGFSQPGLYVDTSCAGDWSATPSPLSSLPATPPPFSDVAHPSAYPTTVDFNAPLSQPLQLHNLDMFGLYTHDVAHVTHVDNRTYQAQLAINMPFDAVDFNCGNVYPPYYEESKVSTLDNALSPYLPEDSPSPF